MRSLRASFSAGSWRIRLERGTDIERTLEEQFYDSGPVLAHPANRENVWALELQKCTTALSSLDRERIEAFIENCVAAPDRVHDFSAWSGDRFRRALLMGFRARGFSSRSLLGRQAWEALRFGAAAALAGLEVLLSLARAAFEPTADLGQGGPWIALYGDQGTRDRLALGVLASVSPRQAISVLVLGRPRTPLREVRKTLASLVGRDVRVSRPFDLVALMHAIPALLRSIREGLSQFLESTASPPLKESSAIAYRVFMGHVGASWQSRKPRPASVVYSQTGLADTSLLEREQQLGGAHTTHLVHGVSLGRNFLGFSDLGLFQCLHDAQWHAKLGGYRRCTHEAMPMPPLVRGDGGWLLLSNLIHPVNPDYQARGIAGELELLDCIAACATQRGVAGNVVTWKPHPVFFSQSESVRNAVLSKVAALGFRCWDPKAPMASAIDYQIVISTRSTVLLDLLRMGKLPVLADLAAGHDPGTALGRMPLVARSAGEMMECLQALDSDVSAREHYEAAWDRIGPGRTDLSMERILQLADAGTLAREPTSQG